MHTAKKAFRFDSVQGEKVIAPDGAVIELEEVENVKSGAPSSFVVTVDGSSYEVDEPTYRAIEERIK